MLLLGDCNDKLNDIQDNSIDLLVTDPPYGLEFMGKDWDRVVVPTETWKECYRVLKQGKLAFVMCSPRQDVLARMIINLQDAGFRTNYSSIYWTFASGFPKAANVSKLIDKGSFKVETERREFARYLKQQINNSQYTQRQIREYLGLPMKGGGQIPHWITEDSQPIVPSLDIWNKLKTILRLDDQWDSFVRQEHEREIIGQYIAPDGKKRPMSEDANSMFFQNLKQKGGNNRDITKPATEEAKKMEGAYVGFQPKPALEVILCVSKGKTLTWLDDCRIPYQSEDDRESTKIGFKTVLPPEKGWNNNNMDNPESKMDLKGRFPANLLVSDDVLNNGKITKSSSNLDRFKGVNVFNRGKYGQDEYSKNMVVNSTVTGNDEGSYSRYFSLDSWAEKTLPFLICPKASKAERNKGVETLEPIKVNDGRNTPIDNPFQRGETLRTNSHPTVKPLKLMSYLITMGSREGDLVLDPFCGSGTVLIAADQLHRKWIGIERNPEYAEIIKRRLMVPLSQLKLTVFE